MLGSWRAKAGVAAAGMLVGVLAVGTALAAGPQEQQAGHGKYADSFVTRLAGALGVDKTALVGAAKQAATATVDEAATNGDLNQTQAERMKERIQSGEFPGGFGHGGFRGGPGGMHGGMRGGMMGGEFGTHMAAVHQALATQLGMTPGQLKQEMMSGKTLHAVGQEKGVSDADLKATILGVAGPALEKAVQDGKLTQAQADQMLQKIQNMDLNQTMGHDGGHKPGHGMGEGRGKRQG